ncbi:hypothetical protein RUM43_010103 [Polyplax serrata]|uniref:Uncharacterized protein n=1 Tax=Polyplax serrata TaxID=468196 RepID=A0AAN8Q4A7_POLSC
MDTKLTVLLLFFGLCNAQTEKWVWGTNGRSRSDRTRIVTGDKRYTGELVSRPLFEANYNRDRESVNLYRYEVTEEPAESTFSSYRPTEHYRPDPSSNRPYRPPPDFVRPTNVLVDNYRPTNRPHEGNYRPIDNGFRPPNGEYPLHGLRPGVGTNGRPILTGPTPSWEQEDHRKYKDYDICKCVHSFNCNTPGIKFGTCDADKQYCCYKSKRNEGNGYTGKPTTGYYEKPRPRPVLAGPGGPVDYPAKPYQNKVPSRRPVEDRETDLEEAYRKGLASTLYQYETRRESSQDRELDEAYRKGLASTLHKVEYDTRLDSYYDRDRQRERDRYPYDRETRLRPDNFKGSHPLKYGLYDPSAVDVYARSVNSTISAVRDRK